MLRYVIYGSEYCVLFSTNYRCMSVSRPLWRSNDEIKINDRWIHAFSQTMSISIQFPFFFDIFFHDVGDYGFPHLLLSLVILSNYYPFTISLCLCSDAYAFNLKKVIRCFILLILVSICPVSVQFCKSPSFNALKKF